VPLKQPEEGSSSRFFGSGARVQSVAFLLLERACPILRHANLQTTMNLYFKTAGAVSA
jgi:hypothetical protein